MFLIVVVNDNNHVQDKGIFHKRQVGAGCHIDFETIYETLLLLNNLLIISVIFSFI